MAPPYQVGDILRSFIRIPDDGTQKFTKTILHDLGRISTLAATIAVPQDLPPVTNMILQSPSQPVNMNIQKLKEENKELKSENLKLRKQLSLFKQLIMNPIRHNSVLYRLKKRKIIIG